MSDPARWCGFHLHYHGDLDLLVSRLVHPLVSALAESPGLHGFFFVRFALGGPHVRLRLCLTDAAREAARPQIEGRAAAFFAEHPAAQPLSVEEIRCVDAVILANDPHERDTGFVPAPSVHERPFEPELSRYGGEARMPASLAAFGLSSARALRFLGEHMATPRARRLPLSLRLIVAEAVGLAEGAEDLLALLAARLGGRDEASRALIARADRAFTEQRETLCRLVRSALGSALDARPTASLALAPLDPRAAGSALAAAIADAPAGVRRQIAESHLHMSANRLGVSNAEEVYLGRIAWSAASLLLGQDLALAAQLDQPSAGADDVASAERALREAAVLAARALGKP